MVCDIVVRAVTLLEHAAEEGQWVDKEQLESFIEEYNRSSDKERFLSDRQEQCFAIYQVHLNISLLFVS